MPAIKTYAVIRSFPLQRYGLVGPAAMLTAVPGDTLRSDGPDHFVLVRGDGGAETRVETSPGEFGRHVRAEL